jgi:hypothetical protein
MHAWPSQVGLCGMHAGVPLVNSPSCESGPIMSKDARGAFVRGNGKETKTEGRTDRVE